MDTTNELQISSAELKKHSTRQDCWVAVHSKVWDLTDFLDEHPGGAKSKLDFFGWEDAVRNLKVSTDIEDRRMTNM